MRYLSFILIFLCLSDLVSAQKDSLSFRERYMPTGLRIGTDAIALAKTFFDESYKGWEVSADLDFHRYFLAFEYGKWSRMFPGEQIDYFNSGRYWRIGGDVNFLTKDPDRNMFFLGLRYGRGKFDEIFRVVDTHPEWGTNDRYDNPYINDGVPARWFELTSGLKVKMFTGFWMGFTARFKFGLKTGNTPEMLPYDVPGFGNTNKETTWGFNYQLMFRLPFRAQPPLPPVKKKK